jgi:hypothetical protein
MAWDVAEMLDDGAGTESVGQLPGPSRDFQDLTERSQRTPGHFCGVIGTGIGDYDDPDRVMPT